jgi:hypothetical protein
MGANATTFVPSYTSGEVLTAANLSVTNSGIPVFATTVTRDAAFGGTGEKTLAEGQFAYIEASNTTQYYDGAAWQSVGVSPGLVLIKTQTIGTTVASVEVTDAFSATYENYLITVNGGVGSTDLDFQLQLGATTANYYGAASRATWAGAASVAGDSNTASFRAIGRGSVNALSFSATIQSPNLAKVTVVSGAWTQATTGGLGGNYNGFLNNTTTYTAFTLIPSTGTITGGIIRVYGYANS